MMLDIRGEFRMVVKNPDGSIASDTGPCPNVITHYGIETILNSFAGNDGQIVGVSNTGDQISGGEIGLGTGSTAVDYTTHDTDLPAEITYESGFGRIAIPANSVVLTVGATKTTASTIVFTVTFPAGFVAGSPTITQIGLFSVDGTFLFAGGTCTSTVVTIAQSAVVTYTISLVQAA
jgi:hypothetical protein